MSNLAELNRQKLLKEHICDDGEPIQDFILKRAGGPGSTIDPIEIDVLINKYDFHKDATVAVYRFNPQDPYTGTGTIIGYGMGSIFTDKPGVTVDLKYNGASGTITVDWSGIFADVDVTLSTGDVIKEPPNVNATQYQISTTL